MFYESLVHNMLCAKVLLFSANSKYASKPVSLSATPKTVNMRGESDVDNGCVLRGGFTNIKVLRGRCKCDLAPHGRAFVPRFAVVEHETSSRYQAAIMLNR
jgi:hypothetical protein